MDPRRENFLLRLITLLREADAGDFTIKSNYTIRHEGEGVELFAYKERKRISLSEPVSMELPDYWKGRIFDALQPHVEEIKNRRLENSLESCEEVSASFLALKAEQVARRAAASPDLLNFGFKLVMLLLAFWLSKVFLW